MLAFIPLPVNRFPNKVVPNAPNNKTRNKRFCKRFNYFHDIFHFLICIINVGVKDSTNSASAVDAAAISRKGIKILLANSLSTFLSALMLNQFLVTSKKSTKKSS